MRIYTTTPISWQKLLHVRSAIHMGVHLPPYDMFTLYKSRRIDALIEPIGKSCQNTLYTSRDFIAYMNCMRDSTFDSPKDSNYKAVNILGETIYVPHTFQHGDKIVIDNTFLLTTANANISCKVNMPTSEYNNTDEYMQVYLI